ncbi:hypothetical protein [Gottfriedia acidiceleris]|uniref:hypothetical protein n=1 Tax=Gottfriedia acidiceleris TaxID=371036 RepID=UPI003B5861E8
MIVTDKSIKVDANSKKKSTVAITVPKSAKLGIYEGFVTYTNLDNPEETFQVPFVIKTVEEGMGTLEMTPQAFTQIFDSAYIGQLIYTNAIMSIKSHMRTLDVILEDGKTGQDIGFVGTMDGLGMDENITYGVSKIFNGYYYKFTGDDDNPIAYDTDLAKPGYYKLKIIGTNDAGNQYSIDAPIYFDNTAPKMSVNSPDILEYKNGQSSVTITGSVYDNDTEEMQKLGMDVNQGSTKVYYQDQLGGRAVAVPVNPDGTFTATIPTNSTRAMLPAFYALDAASNKTFKEVREIFITRDDVTYGFMQPEKRTVKTGETGHATLKLNKANGVKQAVYKFYHNTSVATMNIAPNPSVVDKVDVKVDDKVWSGDLNEATMTIKTKDGVAPLSGDLNLADLTFKTGTDYVPSPVIWPAYMYNVTVTDTTNTTRAVPSGNPTIFYGDPTQSLFRVSKKAEAFLDGGGSALQQVDYAKMGEMAISSNGTVYNGKNKSSVVAEIHNLPLTDDHYEFILDVPGHFTVHKDFTIGFHEDGKVINQNFFYKLNPAIAGDVNKDDVIDVMDAIFIQTYWGTNKRAADINFEARLMQKIWPLLRRNT